MSIVYYNQSCGVAGTLTMIHGLEHMIKAVAALPDFGANMALEIASANSDAPTMATTSSVNNQVLSYIKCTLFDVRPDHEKNRKGKENRKENKK